MNHLYIHVPFCRRKCTYCDFSIAVRKVIPGNDFVHAIECELQARRPQPQDEPLVTVYLGGGTPSLLGAEGIERLFDVVRSRFAIAPDGEVTLEANPDDVTLEAVKSWRAAGVNRLSIGAQSFDAKVLEWMHRTHTPDQTARAVDHARAGGITDLSLDLIFALPSALRRDWERDLSHALSLSPDHLSLYGLTVEPGTPLGRWQARGDVTEAPEEKYEREFLAAHDRLSAAGFEHYEVSNYARAGARARHNGSYWRRVPYLGLGPSAHSFDGERRWWNIAPYTEWSRAALGGGDVIEDSEVLSAANEDAERVYLGLRTMDGLSTTPSLLETAAPWIDAGWAVVSGGRLSLTAMGWLRLDTLATHLTAIASRS